MNGPWWWGGTLLRVTAEPSREQRRLLDLLDSVAGAIAETLAAHLREHPEQRRNRGERPGQFGLDLVADAAALPLLTGAGVGVLSEESGLDDPGNGIVVVVDPVDGSTNASRRIPWYATSLCAVVDGEPSVSIVQNLATGVRHTGVRGVGADRDGVPIAVGDARRFEEAFLILNGYQPEYLQWRQYRSLGATALDLCAVADGSADATMDCADDALGPWDYLGAALIITEAGGHIGDAFGRDLVALDHSARRVPVSAGTEELFEFVGDARRRMPAW